MLIAGPTASGKSALALALADVTGGIIINTDSMQVYRDLRVLTARPTPDEEARAPHRLYGYCDAAVNCSAGLWVADAALVLAEARAANRLPIFIGGTGLYFKALTRGLSAVPPIPQEVREDVRARLERDGVEALHAELARRDPVSGDKLKPRDSARVARALEVIEATGRALPDWHREGLPPLLEQEGLKALFSRPTARSFTRASTRGSKPCLKTALWMRWQRWRRASSNPMLPAMKAHGVPALIRHLAGEITLAEAVEIGQVDTRHYAKRQFTWFRHQLPEFEWMKPEAAQTWLTHALSLSPEAAEPVRLERPAQA